MKKLVGLAAAGAMLLGLAAPVLASVLVVNLGEAFQETGAMAVADTGGNSYTAGENGGSISQSGDITTGNAGAVAVAQATANWYETTVWSFCECDVEVENEGGAEQGTGSLALAGTGENSYLAGDNEGDITQSGDTTTGNALAAASAQSWANIFTTFVGAP
ncbi:MAG: hypothetical protein ACOYT7_03660 [Patescibacteria group bacterium]